MKTYTFIAEYKGGTYISQYMAHSLVEALPLWVIGLDKKIFSKVKKEKILSEVNNSDLLPIPLKEVHSVWCSTFLSNKSFLLLNIVETCGSVSELVIQEEEKCN